MAGIIANLGSGDALQRYRRYGAYSTRIERPDPSGRGWGTPREATIADYVAIREGDLVFFFHQRFIYGVGRVVALPGARRAALCNYPQAWDLASPATGEYLWTDEPRDLVAHPFVIFFEPHPCWFAAGIDMDEALSSDVHNLVTMLPFFAGVSFIRIDDFEASYLASLITRASASDGPAPDDHSSVHRRAAEIHGGGPADYDIDMDGLIRAYSADGRVRHEALLEAWVVDALVNRFGLVSNVFERPRRWDFVGRQIPASPFKPPDYIDRVDILSYDFEPPVQGALIPAVRRYLALELKKDPATRENVLQTLKYVDWLAHTRLGGDYTDIEAAIIASSFPPDVAGTDTRRQFVRSRRPYDPDEWNRLRMIRYEVSTTGPAVRLST